MGAAYPPAPWKMYGSLWLTMFRLGHDVDELRPAGWYGAALVEYADPSPLTYRELLVARFVGDPADTRHRYAVTITDIWVDSPASRAGGRELWAIPKELCDFTHTSEPAGPRGLLTRTSWRTTQDGRPIAAARFTDASRYVPRLPFSSAVEQPGIDDHPDPAALTMSGSAQAAPCHGRWDFAADGPLAYLRDARRLASFRLSSFRLNFG